MLPGKPALAMDGIHEREFQAHELRLMPHRRAQMNAQLQDAFLARVLRGAAGQAQMVPTSARQMMAPGCWAVAR